MMTKRREVVKQRLVWVGDNAAVGGRHGRVQVLGSLPGRVHVPPRLHQKTRPTYLSGASQRSLRHLPPYLSRSRPAITTAVTSMLCRYITFNLIVVRAHCFSLAAGARKNRMWADSACALFSPARRLRFIHSPRTAPTYFLPALSRACVLAVGSSRRGCVGRTSIRPVTAGERCLDYV